MLMYVIIINVTIGTAGIVFDRDRYKAGIGILQSFL